MSDNLKKGPPPLPKEALNQVPNSEGSPWGDEPVISSAPKPEAHKPVNDLAMPTWAGRPILSQDHAQDLELNAAVNEFGLKMPREQAEDEAHKDYVKNQRTQAASHHLLGMKAALAGGDQEAARKHHMMYSLHTKVLGTEPVGPPHPDVKKLLDKGGQKLYKFKAHKGDAFAVQDHGESKEQPEMTKSQRDALYLLHVAGSAVLAKASVIKFPGNPKPAEDKGKEADEVGLKRWALDQGRTGVGGVSGKPQQQKRAEYEDMVRRASAAMDAPGDGKYKVGQLVRHIDQQKHPDAAKIYRAFYYDGKSRGPILNPETHQAGHHYEVNWPGGTDVVSQDQLTPHLVVQKGEMSDKSKKVNCACEAYKFPHRHGGGYCRQKKP